MLVTMCSCASNTFTRLCSVSVAFQASIDFRVLFVEPFPTTEGLAQSNTWLVVSCSCQCDIRVSRLNYRSHHMVGIDSSSMTRECHADSYSLATNHAFDCARLSVIGNGSTNRTREPRGSIGSAKAHRYKPSATPILSCECSLGPPRGHECSGALIGRRGVTVVYAHSSCTYMRNHGRHLGCWHARDFVR